MQTNIWSSDYFSYKEQFLEHLQSPIGTHTGTPTSVYTDVAQNHLTLQNNMLTELYGLTVDLKCSESFFYSA